MMALDVPTLRFLSALELFILPSLLWAFLRPGREMTAMRIWIKAGWVMAVGNLLLLQWNVLTFPGKDLLIRLVFVSYLVLRIQSLRLDLGMPLGRTSLALGYLAYVGLHEAVRYFAEGPRGLLIMTSTVTTVLTGYLVWLAWRIAQIEQSRSALWLASGLAFYTILFFFRVMALITGNTPLDQLGSSLTADAIAIAIVLVPMVEQMGYLGICIERAQRAERAAVAGLSLHTELEALGQQIAVLDRRRSLGEMAAALSHELKQPLTAVLTSAQVAELGLQDGRLDNAQLTPLLSRIADNARRANQLIERISRFVRPSALMLRRVDLNEVVREALALSEGSFKSAHINARVSYAPFPVVVKGDALQLSQVALNLIRNAIEATDGRSPREIDVDCFPQDAHGVIRVRDNGGGFQAETLDRLGSAFFTTKPSGMGMGLAICQAITRQHAGCLLFLDAEGQGAQVELVLPLAAEGQPTGVS